jgi:proline dehydrogenase
MAIARSFLLRAASSQWLAAQVTKRAFTRRAALRFMPGEDVGSALEASGALAGQDIGTILTQLGENVTTPGEAAAVREHYQDVIEQIAERGLPSQISVKPTHLGLDIAFDACLAHIKALAEQAAATGQLLWIDMEDSRYVEPTLELYRELRTADANVGVCLQAYLRRTPDDLKRLLPLEPVIRLVKGAYNEPAAVALPVKREVDERFFKLGRRLMEHSKQGRSSVVFGTHDLKLVKRLREEARRLECDAGTYEFHMLYGIKARAQKTLAQEGERVRVLVSYGSAWFPWYMRRLAERPANVWFVVRSFLLP